MVQLHLPGWKRRAQRRQQRKLKRIEQCRELFEEQLEMANQLLSEVKGYNSLDTVYTEFFRGMLGSMRLNVMKQQCDDDELDQLRDEVLAAISQVQGQIEFKAQSVS
jgi:hypothetical protein